MKHRTDHNQAEIIKAFETLGCSVFDLSNVGGGLCDLLVGLVGVNLLVEIKKPKGTDNAKIRTQFGIYKGKLTPAQTDFFKTWKGQKAIITTQAEAIKLVDAVRKLTHLQVRTLIHLQNSKPITRSKS